MKINNQHYRSIWWNDALQLVQIIDQRYLPHQLVIQNLCSLADCATAIRDMWVRGAPLIGVTAAYGMYYAALQANNNNHLQTLAQQLIDTRPTAVNLRWAVEQQLNSILAQTNTEKHAQLALQNAHQIANQDVEICRMIGVHGLNLLQQIAQKKETINILTHCNAHLPSRTSRYKCACVGKRNTPAQPRCKPNCLGAKPKQHCSSLGG